MGDHVALLFPGQGSQAVGMAEGLWDDPLTTSLCEVAKSLGCDLRTALNAPQSEALTPTQIAQPALYLVGVVSGMRMRAAHDVVATAGHSVGEIAALAVAGAIDPKEGMKLVCRRGALMAQARQGTMSALLGASRHDVDTWCHGAPEGVVVVANHNAPEQVVVSGDPVAVEWLGKQAKEHGVRRVIPLAVSGAFHSPLMEDAGASFGEALDATSFMEPSIPVIPNVTTQASRDFDVLKEALRVQITHPVEWVRVCQELETIGVTTAIECGPGSVLAGLLRKSVPEIECVSWRTVSSNERAVSPT